jgi:hypothetical protein
MSTDRTERVSSSSSSSGSVTADVPVSGRQPGPARRTSAVLGSCACIDAGPRDEACGVEDDGCDGGRACPPALREASSIRITRKTTHPSVAPWLVVGAKGQASSRSGRVNDAYREVEVDGRAAESNCEVAAAGAAMS